MAEISLSELCKIMNAELRGNKNTLIGEIITDSRSLAASDEQLFFALKGNNHNGHNFINELYEKGVINFVVSEYNKKFSELQNANFLIVNDTLDALQDLGKYFRSEFKNHLTAITGSNGKTIVKEWLFQLLRDDYKIVKSPKSYNSQTGVPLSLSLLENTYDLAFIEVGISRKGEMKKQEKIVMPDTVIFVSLGEAHQENFKDKAEKAKEKLILAKNAEVLIYSPDYKKLNDIIKKYPPKKAFTWSEADENSDLFISKIKKQADKTEITAYFQEQEITYKIPFIDEASIKNSFACLSFLLSKNIFTEKIKKRFEALEAVEMRIEQKQGVNNCLLINDSYNSDIISLKIALDTLEYQSVHKNKTLILSDIYQSGTENKVLYSKAAKYAKSAKINKFIGIGKNISECKTFFSGIEKTFFFKTTEDFLSSELRYKFRNENILIKGSRDFKFERISDILQLKKHRTVLEVNTEAIVHNLNYYKSLLKKDTKITVMVKAFSYGSGTYEIAKLMQHHKVDFLGVALTDEGVELRNSGITADIIVMNPDEDGFSDIIEHRLEPEIYGFGILNAYAEKVEACSGKKMPVHIKIDTGMKRLGFCDYEINDLIKLLKKYPQIYVKTVYSHLAASDEPRKDNFTLNQISKFRKISEKIINELGYHIDRHILNSAGIERFPEYQFEAVRLGIGLYGFGFYKDKLMNVSTLKTKILQIKNVKKNETVGYGRKWSAKRDSLIAVLPIGYADGFNRALSNGIGEVLINGKLCPVIGNICMDMCMVDATDVKTNEGEEAVIFGDDYPADKLAEKLNTIPYEILTGVSERVKRVYIG